jgi:hypothetical protein
VVLGAVLSHDQRIARDGTPAELVLSLSSDELVGVITIYRQEVRPFTEKQIAENLAPAVAVDADSRRRVETIPGIGVIGASAIAATVSDPMVFLRRPSSFAGL